MSSNSTQVRTRERVPTGRRGRPSKSMIAAAMERPFCAYLHKICLNNRLEGHKYCIDHIMNDKTAPYRQCTFIHHTTGRRCSRAAHKVDRRASPLCQYHKALRLNAPPQQQYQPNANGQITSSDIKAAKRTLLEDLAHHKRPCPPDETKPDSINTYWNSNENGTADPSGKLMNVLRNFNIKRLKEDLEPLELPSAEEIATRHNNADSDSESVDNSHDLFRNASIYTEEEILRNLRDKMIRLRRLYIEQYSHIQYLLKEKRLKFIQSQRTEDEIYGDVYSFRNYPDNPEYPKLRAMLRYHRSFGSDSLLQDKAKKEKQARPSAITAPHRHNHVNSCQSSEQTQLAQHDNATNAPTLCVLSKTDLRCDKPNLPLSPYCKQHILYDNKQVLFRPCAGGIPPCLTPIASYTRKNKCWLHTAIN